MYFHGYRRLFLLAGFAASVCVAFYLLNRVTDLKPSTTNSQSGVVPSADAGQIVVTQPVRVASASVSQHSKNSAVPVSIRQILPQLDQTIGDWRGYQPRKLTIAPYSDLALEFEMTSVRQEGGRTIWRGRNALSGAFLVTVATQNEWHAVLEIPAASSFEFHISGQAATVTENDASVLCGGGKLVAAAAVAGAVDDSASLAADAAENETDDSATTDVNTVDVLFFYDAATLAANSNNTQRIETTIVSLLESANSVLQNSSVSNLRWHYVAAYQVPDYVATGSLQDDLNQISNSSNAVGKLVADKCALHGVDQAVLFVGSRRADNNDGLAWVPSGEGTVAHNSAIIWNSGYVILAHEMAHNFGCRHDRQTEGAAQGDGKYSYGFRFDLNGKDTGTVMSYAPTRIPFFSNPNCMYAGICIGTSPDSGVEANNSRVLREHAEAMAAYRVASKAPIITANPQSVNINGGAGFSMSVSATGITLHYQWKKNGVDLPGATDAAYSKPSATGTDDGVYNVVVSNTLGQASSESASVVVTAAATASASAGGNTDSSTGSGGGGGGGAVGPWALAALALIGSLRLVGRAHRDR